MKGTGIITAMLLVLSSAASYGDIYTWKDGRGVAHFTNSIHEIPARYLKKARVLDVATGKLGGLATEQPVQKAGQVAQPGQAAQPGPNGAPMSPPAAPVASAPAAVAPPATPVPPQSTIKLPPPTPEAQRKMNRIRAHSRRSGSSGEE